jgi:hypothetical protein
MLSVGILIYIKSVVRYIFLILFTYHLNTLDLREQECEDPWLFFEAKTGPRRKCLGNSGVGAVSLWLRLQDVDFEFLFPASGFIL